jgi:hypothetical protein
LVRLRTHERISSGPAHASRRIHQVHADLHGSAGERFGFGFRDRQRTVHCRSLSRFPRRLAFAPLAGAHFPLRLMNSEAYCVPHGPAESQIRVSRGVRRGCAGLARCDNIRLRLLLQGSSSRLPTWWLTCPLSIL